MVYGETIVVDRICTEKPMRRAYITLSKQLSYVETSLSCPHKGKALISP